MYIQTNTGFGQATTTFDINKAIRNNRIYGQLLGWQKYYDNIVKFLGLTGKPSDITFAQAVARWQQSRGLKADGMIGPATWKAIQTAIVQPVSGTNLITVPEVVITGVPCYPIFDFDFDSSKLKPTHIAQINSLAKQIVDSYSTPRPIRTVYAKGHTDPVGTLDYNQALGMRRALAVRKELMRALDRTKRYMSARVLILASSRGEKDAKYSDANKNRRVEVCLSTKHLKPRHKKEPPPPPRPSPPNGKKHPQCPWESQIDWNEKFTRHFESCCSNLHAARAFCPFQKFGIEHEICKLTNKQLEERVNTCVFQNVHAEVVQETGIVAGLGKCDPAAITMKRFTEWKAKTGKSCFR